jgi:hypothetical protein
MNQAPFIQGAVRLHEAGVIGYWLDWAMEQGEALIRQIGSDGLLSNGWGDLPGRAKAPVIGFSASGALYALAGASGRDRYRDAADRILFGYEERFGVGDSLAHGVANQAARWALTRLQRYHLLGENEDCTKAVRIGHALLPELVQSGSRRGGMHQSRSSDILISVYVGKSLYPLLALYEAVNEIKFLEAARAIAAYLLANRTAKEGLFISYAAPQGPLYRASRFLGAVDRRFLGSRFRLYRLRRAAITDWRATEYPVFIARAADSIRGLAALATHEGALKPAVEELLTALLEWQLAHGGFPNTVGFTGTRTVTTWQDVVAPTRWNGYVFQLLADLVIASGLADLPQPAIAWPVVHHVGPDQRWLLVEKEGMILLYPAKEGENAPALWQIDKDSGQSKVLPAWRGESTKDRTWKQMKAEGTTMNNS